MAAYPGELQGQLISRAKALTTHRFGSGKPSHRGCRRVGCGRRRLGRRSVRRAWSAGWRRRSPGVIRAGGGGACCRWMSSVLPGRDVFAALPGISVGGRCCRRARCPTRSLHSPIGPP